MSYYSAITDSENKLELHSCPYCRSVRRSESDIFRKAWSKT